MKYVILHDDDFHGPVKEVTVNFDSYKELTLKVPISLLKLALDMRSKKEEDIYGEPEWTPEEAKMEREAMFARREARKKLKELMNKEAS